MLPCLTSLALLLTVTTISSRNVASGFAFLPASSPSHTCNSVTTPTVTTAKIRNVSCPPSLLHSTANDDQDSDIKLTPEKEEAVEKVANLVADDEWMGLSMEVTELVRCAVIEDVKKNTRDFIGKEEYKLGDISKEIDSRVKTEVASLRDKDEYELGDLSVALDTIAKNVTCELTGKDDYEFGDLSTEIDTRIKDAVAGFCGKDEYEPGDLSREVSNRVQTSVAEFTGKEDYEFGDVSREVERRRKEWVRGFLGEEAAEEYEFGDLTKKALANFTGKKEYEFGDVSKKIMGDLFGKRKRGGGGSDDGK